MSPPRLDLETLTLDQIARRLPRHQVMRALEGRHRYASMPAFGGGWVSAIVDLPDTQDRGHARVGFGVDYYNDLTRKCDCGDDPYGRCEHTAALLVDLAISPALRLAIVRRGDVTAALAALPSARRAALAERQVDEVLEDWSIVVDDRREEPVELFVEANAAPLPNQGSQLIFRVRRPGKRAAISAGEMSGMRVPEWIRRVLSGCKRSGKQWLVYDPHAAAILDALRTRDVRSETTGESLVFESSPVAIRFEAVPSQGQPVLRAYWISPDGAKFRVDETVWFLGVNAWVVVVGKGLVLPMDPSIQTQVLESLRAHAELPIPEQHAARIYDAVRGRFRGSGVRFPPGTAFGSTAGEVPRIVVRIEGSPLEVTVAAVARYTRREFPLSGERDPAALDLDDADDAYRDIDEERFAIDRIASAGIRGLDANGVAQIVDDAAVAFWRAGLSALRAIQTPPVEVEIAANLAGIRVRERRIGARGRIGLRRGMLQAAIAFAAEAEPAQIDRLRAALKRGTRWVVLDDGSLAAIHERVASLLEELPAQSDGNVELPMHQLGRVDRWADLLDDIEIDAPVSAFRDRLRTLAVSAQPELPAAFGTELRAYQKSGLAWLQFLHALGTGGILADDMGLGKTVMTLALLAWRKERDGLGTSLIVCPASMIGTWRREIARFAPSLSVFVLHGGDRHAGKSEIAEYDVVITTYALLVREIDTLRAVRFRHAVFDEAQNIKNADAVSTRAARLIEADQHLALSGTPVENRLDELWSIMECCNPGMLGDRRTFQRHFERPIAEDPKHPAATELRAIVRPFMLRRRKSEVLDDLPAKQEIDLDCELSGPHRKLYDSLAAAVRREIESAFAKGGLAKNTFNVLTALLRLRQMACDPRLVDANADGAMGAKRTAFLELVQQLVAEKRRALVFSQFVKLFDLWRPDLDALGIAYEYLDGSTVDRDRVVQRFQNGDAPLFLLSLKAGGTGLTLTAADTVIHVDPWWNPAVETQATDRAHRIGQKQSVTVYRLVAKGTIEDRIDELKKRKRDVADAIVSDAGGALGGLAEEDVLRLLGQSEG